MRRPSDGGQRARPERDLVDVHRDVAGVRDGGDSERRERGGDDSQLLHTAIPQWNRAVLGLRAQGRQPSCAYNPYTVKRLLIAVFLLAAALPATAAASPKVLAIDYTTDVNPVTQDWLNTELSHAQDHGYSAAVIVLDTPGGLEESMRKIVQRELSLRIPVIVYVSPNGARAASAGVWISQAADLLAMAPQTNIGSSTPIDSSGQNIGKDLKRKGVNDAVASLTALANAHGPDTTVSSTAGRL